jgi:hypothetical protein
MWFRESGFVGSFSYYTIPHIAIMIARSKFGHNKVDIHSRLIDHIESLLHVGRAQTIRAHYSECKKLTLLVQLHLEDGLGIPEV